MMASIWGGLESLKCFCRGICAAVILKPVSEALGGGPLRRGWVQQRTHDLRY